MNFLEPIYNQINSDEENSRKKGTFYSLINYIVANDEPTTHYIKKKDMQERFSLREDYPSILELLLTNEVLINEEDDKFIFNDQAKQFISPLLKEVLNTSFREKLKNCDEINLDQDCPNIQMLLDCRSNLYSS